MRRYLLAISFLLVVVLPSPLRAETKYVSSIVFTLAEMPPVERAIACIKHFEGWHTKKNYPYCGWGHRIWPGEKLSYSLTVTEADSLLVRDLTSLCKIFQPFGEYCLLLAVLAYNVGPYSILGNSTIPESRLIKKIKAGDTDIIEDYLSFCHCKGKFMTSIRRRRFAELLLFMPRSSSGNDNI